MPHPVFSHLFGTLALIGILLSIMFFFSALFYITTVAVIRVQLNEIAEYVSRIMVELVALESSSNTTNLVYKTIRIPPGVNEQGYTLYIDNGTDTWTVALHLDSWSWIKGQAEPTFETKGNIKIIADTKIGEIYTVKELYSGTSNPVVIAYKTGGKVYIGIGYITPSTVSIPSDQFYRKLSTYDDGSSYAAKPEITLRGG